MTKRLDLQNCKRQNCKRQNCKRQNCKRKNCKRKNCKRKNCKRKECNNTFIPVRRSQMFCSKKCTWKHRNSTPECRANRRKYSRTKKGQIVIKRYKTTDNARDCVKRYQQTEKGKLAKKKGGTKYRNKYPEKILAHKIANKYLSNKSCEVNSCPNIGQKHHEDYGNPLDVVYLCHKHHTTLHRKVVSID